MMSASNFFLVLSSPGPIAFKIGNLDIRWYGIFIAIAFIVGYLLAERLVKKNNLSLSYFADLVFYALISSIIFARLWFVVLNLEYFKDNLSEIPKIWLGGQSIHGGIFGGILAALIYVRIKNISFYKYIDAIACVFPLGQAIGRWGNFFNNEAFGKPVENSIIRLFIPSEFRPERYLTHEYFHPAFLYESILDFLIFIFLFSNYKKWTNKPGKVFWIYLISYSVIRLLLEFIRTDSLYLFNNIPAAQVICVIIILIGIFFLAKK